MGNQSKKSSTASVKATTTGKVAKTAGGDAVDNRSGVRVPVQLLVDYRSGGNYLFDFCRDLGTGGAFIETSQPLSMGSDIELTFTIPDSKETLTTKGKVIWVQAAIAERPELIPGMGVQFAGFSASQRETLERFISRYSATNRATEKTVASRSA